METEQYIDNSTSLHDSNWKDGESESSEQVYCYDYTSEEQNNGVYSELGSESGVEPDYNEWIFDENAIDAETMVDLTNEQALATLKYFCK